MEYSQTTISRTTTTNRSVLILILMEYSLTTPFGVQNMILSCLNPYSNGILTDISAVSAIWRYKRLNPYSNGILTDKNVYNIIEKSREVLILILMEY